MKFEVLLTNAAVKDLEELYDWVADHDAVAKADSLLTQIEIQFKNLAEMPQRGNHPKELLNLGIREFREIFFKPYRIIYRINDTNVYIMIIADGRRDMQSLLQRRLLAD